MKLATFLLTISLGASAGIAAAATTPEPAQPDPSDRSRRDADPEKCVIQDGPPHRPIVRKPQSPVSKSVGGGSSSGKSVSR